ncbi:VOC family protein [Parasphingorhabdus sp.]|uniref:VOC family protein n=1 Tax=Parasphingorhabdus sp. TaxID=2709688 RepID=UPI003BAED33F
MVDDFDATLEHWTRDLGAGPFFVFEVPILPGQLYYGEPTEVSLKVGFGFSGGQLIELLTQTNKGKSPFLDFLAKNGPGLHHVMPRTDFETGHKRLTDAGFPIAFSGQMPSGERFCLFDTYKNYGYYVELMELSDAIQESLALMEKAQATWDGKTDPVRSMDRLAELAD